MTRDCPESSEGVKTVLIKQRHYDVWHRCQLQHLAPCPTMSDTKCWNSCHVLCKCLFTASWYQLIMIHNRKTFLLLFPLWWSVSEDPASRAHETSLRLSDSLILSHPFGVPLFVSPTVNRNTEHWLCVVFSIHCICRHHLTPSNLQWNGMNILSGLRSKGEREMN